MTVPKVTRAASDPADVGDAQAIIEAARVTNEPGTLDPAVPQVIVIPAGCAAYEPDLSAWRDGPVRPTGTYRPATVEAFTAVVKVHIEEGSSLWVHPTSGRVVAVFDDCQPGFPRYRQHRAHLELAVTPEWEYWAALDGKLVGQEAFAEHIEGGLAEILEPDGATMLEIAQSFRATNNVAFRSSTRLVSGEQQFLYDETIEARAGKSGELSVPTTFVLLVAPFVGEEERQVVAKLRYRLNGGQLTLGYKLERPEKIIRDALDAVAETLRATFPRVYVGEPA